MSKHARLYRVRWLNCAKKGLVAVQLKAATFGPIWRFVSTASALVSSAFRAHAFLLSEV